jgi:threonine/homoserine/homoserine lactone efflux protein
MPPLIRGIVIGFAIAAPVGPIGLICIRRTLAEGRWAGFIAGLGAASADAIYGAVAALGLTAVTSTLLDYQSWLQFGGGVFLICLGMATLRFRPPSDVADEGAPQKVVRGYVETLALTLANPMTILSFVSILASLDMGTARSFGSGFVVVLGVFLGSAAWWLILSAMAEWMRNRLRANGLRIVNVISGLVLAGFGFWQLGVAVTMLRS